MRPPHSRPPSSGSLTDGALRVQTMRAVRRRPRQPPHPRQKGVLHPHSHHQTRALRRSTGTTSTRRVSCPAGTASRCTRWYERWPGAVSSVAPATGSDSDLVGGGQLFRGRDVAAEAGDDMPLLQWAVPSRNASSVKRTGSLALAEDRNRGS